MQTVIAILLLCIGIYLLLCGTAKLLKALGIKAKAKPVPLTEEEIEANKAYKKLEDKELKMLDNLFGFGGGDMNE